MKQTMKSIYQFAEGMHFFSATEAGRVCHSKKLANIIAGCSGYVMGKRMTILKTEAGGYRLYIMPDGVNRWFDANLKDLPEDN